MIKVVFFGTPAFSAKLLAYLYQQENISLQAVVSNPDKPQGRKRKLRPTAVKQWLLENAPQIPLFQPDKPRGEPFYQSLMEFEADVFVVVAYGAILPEKLIHIPQLACINLHTSLLPQYRGAAPIQRALLAGEKESGVSIMHVAKAMDAGDVISFEKIPILPQMTYGELQNQMEEVGKPLLYQALLSLQKGEAKRTKQDEKQVSFAPKISKEESYLSLQEEGLTLHRKICAFSPEPGATFFIRVKDQQKRLKVLKSSFYPKAFSSEVGVVHLTKESLIIKVKGGELQLLEVQLEGKKKQRTVDFLKGFDIAGMSFL